MRVEYEPASEQADDRVHVGAVVIWNVLGRRQLHHHRLRSPRRRRQEHVNPPAPCTLNPEP